MNTRRPKRPMELLTNRHLCDEHGLSWYYILRAVDQGTIVPFAIIRQGLGAQRLFHPDQLPDLEAICRRKPQRRWQVERAPETLREDGAGDALSDAPLSPPSEVVSDAAG
jgi:hypothetical protein